jgi:hypothetical protein
MGSSLVTKTCIVFRMKINNFFVTLSNLVVLVFHLNVQTQKFTYHIPSILTTLSMKE